MVILRVAQHPSWFLLYDFMFFNSWNQWPILMPWRNKLRFFFPEIVCGWLKSDIFLLCYFYKNVNVLATVISFENANNKTNSAVDVKIHSKMLRFLCEFTIWKRRHKCKIRGSLKMDVNTKFFLTTMKAFQPS